MHDIKTVITLITLLAATSTLSPAQVQPGGIQPEESGPKMDRAYQRAEAFLPWNLTDQV